MRRQDCRELLAQMDERIARLDKAAELAAEAHPQASLLLQQKGVGPITALAFALTIGDVSRFPHSNQVASYLGPIPSEHTSSSKRRLGSITKQGNSFVRMLLVEAAQSVTRLDPKFHKQYVYLCRNKPRQSPKWLRHANWPYGFTGCYAPIRTPADFHIPSPLRQRDVRNMNHDRFFDRIDGSFVNRRRLELSREFRGRGF